MKVEEHRRAFMRIEEHRRAFMKIEEHRRAFMKISKVAYELRVTYIELLELLFSLSKSTQNKGENYDFSFSGSNE